MTNPTENVRKSAEEVRALPPEQAKLQESLVAHLSGKYMELTPHAWRGLGLTVGIPRENALEFFGALRTNDALQFDMLTDVTAVDWLDSREKRFEVVYQLLSIKLLHRLCVKIQVPEEEPEVDSIRGLWHAANFLEREVWDMYGIKFAGHGDLRRILMYDEFVGHPLRKDYPLRGKQPRVPLRVPELRNTSLDMERAPLVALPSVTLPSRVGVRSGDKNG